MKHWPCDAVAHRDWNTVVLVAILWALRLLYQKHPLHRKEKDDSVKVDLWFYNLSMLADFVQCSLKPSNQFSLLKFASNLPEILVDLYLYTSNHVQAPFGWGGAESEAAVGGNLLPSLIPVCTGFRLWSSCMALYRGKWALKFPGCCENIPGASNCPVQALPSASSASMACWVRSVRIVHPYSEELSSECVPYGMEKHVSTCDGMDVQSHNHVDCDAVCRWRRSREGSAGARSPMCMSIGLPFTLGTAPHLAAFP